MEQDENQDLKPNKFRWWWVFTPITWRKYETDSKSEVSWWMFFVSPLVWLLPWLFIKDRKPTSSDWLNLFLILFIFSLGVGVAIYVFFLTN